MFPTLPTRPVRVLAVDDSAVMRSIFRAAFPAEQRERTSTPIELCAAVADGVACLDAVDRLRPDVVVLDLEMPRMHGLDVLLALRERHPELPVIMCSNYTEHGARLTLEALSLGARDYVTKAAAYPTFSDALRQLAAELTTRIVALTRFGTPARMPGPRAMPGVIPESSDEHNVPPEVVVIGVSTGGPHALELVLRDLPATFPVPVLIAQHMPRLFTGALADRLNRCCPLPVSEARDDTPILPGQIWVSPGDTHMRVEGVAFHADGPVRPVVRLHTDSERSLCKPSVDLLFRSAAAFYGARTLALVMTGMGADGLAGARAVHQAGGTVLAQDAASSAVWGMPGRVCDAGLVQRPLPLDCIAHELRIRTSRDNRTPFVARPSGYAGSYPRGAGDALP